MQRTGGSAGRRARCLPCSLSPGRTHEFKNYVISGAMRLNVAPTDGLPEAARRRLVDTYGAPAFSWQTLRRTCGTYLTNAAGIFAAASAYRSARQLGHSVQVGEKHYLGLVRGIPREARTLEAAMQVGELVAQVTEAVSPGRKQSNVVRLSS